MSPFKALTVSLARTSLRDPVSCCSSGRRTVVWDLSSQNLPPAGTQLFRSHRTILAWPKWAPVVDGAYESLRTKWAGTRSKTVQGQYNMPGPHHGHDDLVPHRVSALEDLMRLADHFSPTPERFGTGFKVPVWEMDAVTRQVRRGELAVVLHASPTKYSCGADQLRKYSLNELAIDDQVLVNPVCGLVGGTTEQRLDWDTTAPVAGQTPLWGGSGVRPLTWSGQARSFGSSRKAAMLESIERLVGARQHHGQVVRASQLDLDQQGLEYRLPKDFGEYGPHAYTEGVVPFQSADKHDWVLAESLATGREVHVPRDYAFFGQPLSTPRWASVCSSGVATGSTREEAIVFGLMELIERDVFVNSWYAQVSGIAINPKSVLGLTPLLRRATLLGHHIELRSLPSDTGLPVVVAVARGTVAAAFGAAAHPDLGKAAVAAAEEAWTYLPERERVAASDMDRCHHLLESPDAVEDIDDHPLQCVLPGSAELISNYLGDGPEFDLEELRSVDGLAVLGASDLLERLVRAVAKIGAEPFVVRCTAPFESALGLETWSVLATGLSPLDFGWHRQRVLSMKRPFEYCRNVGASAPAKLFGKPHPFS